MPSATFDEFMLAVLRKSKAFRNLKQVLHNLLRVDAVTPELRPAYERVLTDDAFDIVHSQDCARLLYEVCMGVLTTRIPPEKNAELPALHREGYLYYATPIVFAWQDLEAAMRLHPPAATSSEALLPHHSPQDDTINVMRLKCLRHKETDAMWQIFWLWACDWLHDPDAYGPTLFFLMEHLTLINDKQKVACMRALVPQHTTAFKNKDTVLRDHLINLLGQLGVDLDTLTRFKGEYTADVPSAETTIANAKLLRKKTQRSRLHAHASEPVGEGAI